MADRPRKDVSGQPIHGTKRKAVTAISAGSKVGIPALSPTQHPPPPPISPCDSFQIPAMPCLSKPTALAPKVAIPRLPRAFDAAAPPGSIKTGDKHRVNHACEPCRHRKTKCSGERPRCRHCVDFKIICVYADGKRDRVKKELHHMVARIQAYEQLLVEISPTQDASVQYRVSKALENEPISDDEGTQAGANSSTFNFSQGERASEDGETEVSAAVGSIGSLDCINEDFNRNEDSRATGFMGKTSEVTWMHRMKDQLRINSPPGDAQNKDSYETQLRLSQSNGDHPGTSQPLENNGVADSAYNCDDLSLLSVDQVEPYELPPRKTVEFLLQTYLDSVHPTFPIVGKLKFTSQVRSFFDDNRSRPGKLWLAILNLVFAVAAKYSHLVQSESRGDERDHLIYFTRARALSMDADSLLAQPDLQRVQIAALMAFYLLAISQINRSWTVCGLAMRYSLALGLHLRNENPKLSNPLKEIRYRVWWALYGLERTLAAMTGRPTSVVDLDCMTPLPLPIDEESFSDPNSGMQSEEIVRRMRRFSSQESSYTKSPPSSGPSPRSKRSPSTTSSSLSQHSGFDFFKTVPPSLSLYFVLVTQLSTIMHCILLQLYRPSTMNKTWSQIQSCIVDLDKSLENWRSSLPSLFDFVKKQRDQQFTRQRMSLGFLYYSTKMITFRPCLCRIDPSIPHESSKSKDFNRVAATACVQGARDMLDLIPDEPNPVGLNKVTPWWCLTHYMTQAASILILELFFRAEHMPHEANDILTYAKKAVYWLNQMAKESEAAQRAWVQCDDLLRKVAPLVGRSIDDMPFDTPRFQGHSYMHDSQNHDTWGSHQFARQFPGQAYYSGPPQSDDMIFQPSIHTHFDQYLPFDPSAQVTSAAPVDGTTGTHITPLYPITQEMQPFNWGSGPGLMDMDHAQFFSHGPGWSSSGGVI
ncbi:hypothetical protein MMC13_002145 [Lambiella insularis]|nr:hypothetical protein [Lambiella insularis]